jgi:hypothetical protein
MNAPRLIGIVCTAWALFVIASIAVSSREMSLWAGLRTIADTGWGVTTLVDLYAGLVFVGAWIACLERSKVRGAAWFVALMCVGNLATLVYVAVRAFRARRVRDIFMRPPMP